MGNRVRLPNALISIAILCCLCDDRTARASAAVNNPWYLVAEELRADGEALLAFKAGLQDPQGAMRSWRPLESPCLWPGVQCGRVGMRDGANRVVGLELKAAGLRGRISHRLGELSELRKLTIVGNKRITGAIPETLCNCRKLSALDLRGNALSGPIPAGLLSLLPNLESFVVAGNKLSGHLAALFGAPGPERESAAEVTSGACEQLKILDLSQNHLTGALPAELSSCAKLTEVHLGSNFLVGEIPAEYGRLRNLRSLILENNVLDRHLPQELKHCTKLQILDVADNFLTGKIPSSYAEELRELGDLRVASNQLSGPIPAGGKWLRQGGGGGRSASFRGDDGLCGSPLPSCEPESSLLQLCKAAVVNFYSKVAQAAARNRAGEWRAGNRNSLMRRSMLDSSSPSSPQRRSEAARWGFGLALGAASGAICAALLAVILRFAIAVFVTTSAHNKGPVIFNKKITPKMLAFLDQDDPLADAELIGQGGNGKVYRVPLENDVVVAIKSAHNHASDPPEPDATENPTIDQDAKQINAELETLGYIRHRNLVQLWAYVCKPDSHLLIYEYMPQGSLQDAMYRMAAGELTLSWPQRHRIMCGVAQGLAYLHNHSLGSSIVHRDLKPANILLTDDLEAKLADFGLAAIIPNQDTHATTEALAGTIGFIAPEYHQTMRYSHKTDMYSFGVVLAQMLTAREPTGLFFIDNGGSIGGWLRKCLQASSGPDVIDPALKGSGYEGDILLAMKVAVFCTRPNPQDRPSSTEALQMLLQIRNPDPVPSGALNKGMPADGLGALARALPPHLLQGGDTSTATAASHDSSSLSGFDLQVPAAR